jgi:hypothetical protein
MQFHKTAKAALGIGGYDMMAVIVIYCIFAATFLFVQILRAETLLEFKPQVSETPVVTANEAKTGAGQS